MCWCSVHKSLTLERMVEAIEEAGLSNPGFCTACGADAEGCEPDATDYECEECGEYKVMGAEQLLLELA